MNKTLDTLRHMTPQDLAQLGVAHLAYVKPVSVNDGIAYAIHSADGTQLGVAPDRDVAFAAIRQHELEPVSLH